MTNCVLNFAGNSVGISRDREPAARLVEFLFNPAGLLEAVSGLESQRTIVHFQVSDTSEPGQLLITGNHVDPICGSPEQVAYPLMERVTYHLADRSQGGMLFHAACIARNDKALLLPGNSGSGKSTLALWLAKHGFDYLSDELVFIPLGSLDCRGLSRPVHLRSASRKLFDIFEPGEALESRSSADPTPGWMVQPRQAVPQAQLRAIIFPRYCAESVYSLERLAGSQAALKLTSCMVNGRNLPENGFPELLRLARSIPSYSLGYNHFGPVLDGLETIINL